MASRPVLVVGSANMDLVFRSQRMPVPGETILGLGFETHPGGKGANQAVAVGRLGAACAFAGCVGEDAFGEALRASLASAGVDDRYLLTHPGASGTAGILVDAEGRNMIVVAPGANALLTAQDVNRALGETEPDVVLAQLEVPLEAVAAASAAPRFILNPAPARELPDDLLSRCYALTPNESELHALTGVDPVDDEACRVAASRLFEKGVQNVVITLGARGSFWASPQGYQYFPAPTVEAIDTTAAGDAFNGGLATFLAEGRELSNAIALANCVGALCATRRGAQEAMPTREALRTLAGTLL